MDATLACALAPADEHDSTFSGPESRIEANGFDNPIVLSDKEENDYDDTEKQDEERVIADSDDIDDA